MSSPDRDDDDTVPSTKKRKVQRACDHCRRKKIKCDGPQRADNRCSKCISRRTECTYVEPLYRNFYPASYVEKVEGRMQRLEKLLSKLNPDVDIAKELDAALSDQEGGSTSIPAGSGATASRRGKRPTSNTLSTPMAAGPSTHTVSDDLDPSDDESELQKNILNSFNKLSIDPMTYRYHGKSSGLVFIRAAKHLKDQIEAPVATHERPAGQNWRFLKKQYAATPWLRASMADAVPLFSDFPPPDLMDTLVEHYFREINDYLPLLHEPTFKQHIKDGFHHHHGAFGGTVLLVCANGSRFSEDPRVLLEGTDNAQSAGWKWFEMVERVRKSFIAPAHLYDLQIRVLLVWYLQGTTTPHACWTHIGLGVRMGIDIGAHRKKMYGAVPTIEEEMMRRAFWILVIMDWASAYNTGRPTSIHDEDVDLGLPIECDDEYWISPDGERFFQQPQGKPSKVCFFTGYIRLCQILAFAVRTIYSINKSKSALGNGDQQWEQRIVAELDSALNKWVDSVPSHLQWNPDREDHLFLKQSAVLLSHYYQFQIAVHRPFISTRRKSLMMFPSLVLCTNAARSAVRVVSHLYRRTGDPSYKNVSSLFMCAVVLLLNVWGERKSGRTVNVAQDVEYVKKCMEMIKVCERQMATADRFGDILHELLTSGTPLESHSIPQSECPDFHYTQPTSLSPSPPSDNASGSGSPRDHFVQTQDLNTSCSSSVRPASMSSSSLAHALHPHGITAMFGTSTFGLSSNEGTNPSFSLPLHTEELAYSHGYSTPAMTSIWQTPLESSVPVPQLADAYPQHGSATHYRAPPPQQHENDLGHGLQGACGVVQNQFDATTGGGVFGLEPMGYDHTAAIQPIPASSVPTHNYHPQFLSGGEPAGMVGVGVGVVVGSQGSDSDGTPEFAFADDSLAVWTNAPTFFGWDDWGNFLGHVDGAGQP